MSGLSVMVICVTALLALACIFIVVSLPGL
jgi:hypothetical protein